MTLPSGSNAHSMDTVRRAWNWVLDILFPIRCIHCLRVEKWVCDECVKKIKLHTNFFCPICGHFSFYGELCIHCAKRSYLKGAWVIGDYRDEFMKKTIKHFKYRYAQGVGDVLSALVLEYLNMHAIQKQFDMIIPVPLHTRKKLSRGFNQSETIALGVSSYFHAAVCVDIVVRKRNTQPQSTVSVKKKLKNIKGAFFVTDTGQILGKTILLVDDVVTSGATLNECARALHAAGAKEIWGLILAKG